MGQKYNYDLLIDFLKNYNYLCGDGYVELTVSFIMPLLGPDERTREYALKTLLLLTGRTEFRNELNMMT